MARLRFGPFELDRDTGELRRAGAPVRLQPQPARVLALLAGRAGRLVTRDDLRQEIWGRDTFVDFDVSLNYCLARIRSALEDNAEAPRYVETLPRRGYRFIAPVEAVRPFEQPALAVLPFANLNNDPEQDYFADGMTDALITELAQLGGLRVISRQSVLHLKGGMRKIADIGRELNVDAVVEGSALHAGDRVRITAQLVQVEPEQHLWASSQECEMSEVLALQGRVARAVAEAVAARLTPRDLARLGREAQVNPEAHLAYLKARFHLGRWTREGFEKALAYLRQAIGEDPNYAAAHAVMANCLALLGYWGHAPIRIVYPQAKQLALRAVELDDGLGEAHHALAWALWLNDWDLAGCEHEIRRAIELSPSAADTRILDAVFLVTVRELREDAIAEARRGLDLDPLSEFTNSAAAWIFLFAREYERAAAQAARTLEMYPHALQAEYVFGLANIRLGKLADATAALERAASISRDPISLGYLGHVYGLAGRADAARALLNELSSGECVTHKSLASIYAGLGDRGRAFEVLERAYADRDPLLFWLRVAPPFEPLRDDPRFEELWKRLSSYVAARKSGGYRSRAALRLPA
ncbi:MAG: winged helix-turn-helix domain-containing protein [Acidobacteriota bacterium]